MNIVLTDELKEAMRVAAQRLGTGNPRVMLDVPFQDFCVVTEYVEDVTPFSSFSGGEMGRDDIATVYLLMGGETG